MRNSTTLKMSVIVIVAISVLSLLVNVETSQANQVLAQKAVKATNVTKGICVLLDDIGCESAIKLAKETELLIYVQFAESEKADAARKIVDAAGLYGTRIFIEAGAFGRIHLADNLADALVAAEGVKVSRAEVLRVLRPGGRAILGIKELVKPVPAGTGEWSHPYHGPDNNPQSEDTVAKAPYLTQFLAEPYYGPMTQVALASGGRIFKAFGNVAFHQREEEFIDTLAAFNGYNGTLLWKRKLPTGIMVHRNTMIATPELLYVGDDTSCKVIDAETGKLKDEIIPPIETAGGTFWKWMAMEDGVLYAVMGEQEEKDEVMRWRIKRHGWPWSAISTGYDRSENPWGYGKTMLAIDPATKKVLWSYREDEPIDSRAVCMKNGRIYIFRFGAFLACLDAKTGKPIWRKTPADAPQLFKEIGEDMNRQLYVTNWRTTAYLKCSDKALYFAGPQMNKLLVVSTETGEVLWQNPYDNFQLVLRDEGLYGFSGPWGVKYSKQFDPLTGEVLAELAIGRSACTRPTGSVDSIFFRTLGGSVRFDIASKYWQLISPMRPNCNDGVTVANGHLYWWPSVCDCPLTLYGVTCCGPAGDFDFSQKATKAERFEKTAGDITKTANFSTSPADWPTFRADNQSGATSKAEISRVTALTWEYKSASTITPTAPVAAGGLVFVGGSDGIVKALDVKTGKIRWKAYTGGAVRFPPTIWNGRAFVGSGDGWAYCFEAATGKLLWRFRGAPVERKIPVYGSLLSTWPVASGVLVEDGIAYFAAGIVNYDGTHVYALDAETGKIKWQNNTSGHLDAKSQTGVSVQGPMVICGGKLCMAGGNAMSPVVYDITDGKCLNNPELLQLDDRDNTRVRSQHRGWELYVFENMVNVSGQPLYGDPDFLVYATPVSRKMLVASVGDRDITWVNGKKVICYNRIEENRTQLFADNWGKTEIPGVKPLWEYDCQGSVAVAVCKNAVVVLKESEITAVDIEKGRSSWEHSFAGTAIPWGLAIDREGRAIVSLKDGRILCFGESSAARP